MSYEIKGKLIEVFQEVQISDRFKKREFVIERSESGFVDQIKFQLVQDKTALIEGFAKGEEVNIRFDIKGNKWKDNYFVNLQAWKVEKVGSGVDASADFPTDVPPENDVPFPEVDDSDDLPF